MSYDIYRKVLFKASVNEEQKAKMHFFRTCHFDTFMGKLGRNQASFQRLLPLMNELKYGKDELLINQGDRVKNFFILKTGQIQVHTEILYHVFSIQAIGPSQWNVTRTTRTIQVADKKQIVKRGEIFGFTGMEVLSADQESKCFYTAASSFCDLYTIKVRELTELANETNDAELNKIVQNSSKNNQTRPSFHLNSLTADDLVKIFVQQAQDVENNSTDAVKNYQSANPQTNIRSITMGGNAAPVQVPSKNNLHNSFGYSLPKSVSLATSEFHNVLNGAMLDQNMR